MLPQIGFFDVLIGGTLFILILIVFFATFLVKNISIKILLYVFVFILFLATPFLNILILDSFINKVNFDNANSKKLMYIDAYFISGILTNEGKRTINECEFNIYTNNKYPLKPNYKIILKDLNLQKGEKMPIEQSINDFKYDDIKKIKIRCF